MTTQEASGPRPARPADLLRTIALFRAGRLEWRRFVEWLGNRVGDLPDDAPVDARGIEDLWLEVEIVRALAAEAGQAVPDEAAAARVQATLDRMVKALTVP